MKQQEKWLLNQEEGGDVIDQLILAVMIVLAVIVNLEESKYEKEEGRKKQKRLWDWKWIAPA